MKQYFKCIGSVLLILLGYYLLQVLVTAVFAMIGGVGASNIPAAMEEYVLSNSSLITMAFNAVLILLICLFWGRGVGRAEALALRPLPRGGYWPVMACAAATACFLSLALSLLPIPEAALSSYSEQASQGMGEPLAIRLLHLVLFAPVAEELLFRLAIYSRLGACMPRAAARVISCAVFGLMHGALLWAAYAFLVGLCLTAVYDLYRSIAAPILFHIVFNFVGMFLMPAVSLGLMVFALALLLGSAALAVACIGPMKASVMQDNT